MMMRKIELGGVMFAALLAIGYCEPAMAQYGGSQQASPQAQSGQRAMHGSHLDWLTKELNLTDEQKAKVKPILDDQEKQMQALREDTSLSAEQKHEKMKQLHDSTHSQINSILTPDQQKKFAELRQQMGQHRGNKPDESK